MLIQRPTVLRRRFCVTPALSEIMLNDPFRLTNQPYCFAASLLIFLPELTNQRQDLGLNTPGRRRRTMQSSSIETPSAASLQTISSISQTISSISPNHQQHLSRQPCPARGRLQTDVVGMMAEPLLPTDCRYTHINLSDRQGHCRRPSATCMTADSAPLQPA